MTRDQAWALVTERIQNLNLRRHMLATEAVMRALALRLGQDAELWGLAGLLHDIDLESVNEDMHLHAARAAEWLKDALPPEAVQAIRAHNAENLGMVRRTGFEHALAAAETVTGLIVAATLVLPGKKIAELKPKSVLKRMKEPRFAAGVNRETVRECEKLPLPLDAFVELAVEAMRPLGAELGLG